jgi:aryl-alcohol dehydrogenase-like predicted oxidoreductase
MMDAPSPPGDHGRDALGRFLKGNIFGKGNPFARHSAALRKAFYDEATPEDLQQIARKLLNAAKGGDWVAAQVALRWLLGKPPTPSIPMRC